MSAELTEAKERSQRASYWEEVEDLMITNIRSKIDKIRLSEKEWKEISVAVNQQSDNMRTWKQVKYRWLRHLDPNIIKTPFTLEEEKQIISAQKQIGNKWTEISNLIPGRTYWQIKNLWFMKLRRIVESGTQLTDETLEQTGDDDYVLKCGDFQTSTSVDGATGNKQGGRLSDQSLFSTVSMSHRNSHASTSSSFINENANRNSLNINKNITGYGNNHATDPKRKTSATISMFSEAQQNLRQAPPPSTKKRQKVLVPKSETKKRQQINLLTNIISIPRLFSNESSKLDVSTDNDSFEQISPLRLFSKPKFQIKARKSNLNNRNELLVGKVDSEKEKDMGLAEFFYEQPLEEDLSKSQSRSLDVFEGNNYSAYELENSRF